MPELPFPSTVDLLTELVGRESHTPEGQWKIAQYLAQFGERWGLGVTRVHPYPPRAEFAELDPPPCNVTMDINPQGKEGAGELVVFGHFDSIDPAENYPKTYQGNPYQLGPRGSDPDVYGGLKSADMAAGLVSMLLAAQELSQQCTKVRHSVRFLFVGGEEGQSHGIYAALNPQHNLFEGAKAGLSMDVAVGSSLKDSPCVCIGRPGRIGLRLSVTGDAMHVGRYTPERSMRLASSRAGLVQVAIPQLEFPARDESHFQKHMPESFAIVRGWGGRKSQAMNPPDRGDIDIDVVYGNPGLNVTTIIELVRHQVERFLHSYAALEHGERLVISSEPGRRTPFIPPYLEHPNHTFVRNALRAVQEANGKTPVEVRVGRGTEDAGVVVHGMHIPVCTIPPTCEGEHTADEAVSVSSIDRNANAIVNLVTQREPLTTH